MSVDWTRVGAGVTIGIIVMGLFMINILMAV